MFEAAGEALSHIATWQVALALVAGTFIGVLSGALPGGAVPTLVVLLGFAYGMDPFIALPLAIGMVATVPTGDTLPAVLLGMPGSTSGQATILDGNPMAKQGRAGEALAAAYLSSLLGGLFGAIFLFVTIPIARPVVNTFSAAEFFILGMVAIAVVGVVSSGALVKGLMVGAFGLIISTVGFDTITGQHRLSFGSDYLFDGIHIVPVVIGLFALPEFIDMVIADVPIARNAVYVKDANSGRREGMAAVLRNWPLVLRSAGMGVFVGLLPGIGGSLAQWLSYASARQTVRGGTESFGTGDIRGVIAPESANNAVDGGQLVPTLFFGVPGSVGMAIFLGFLIILGLQPGPSMLEENLDLTLTIAFSLVLANVIATGLVLGFTPWLTKIAFVPPNVLVPLVLPILTLAAFQANFSIADLIVMLSFGALGFVMKTYSWPRPPVIISLILGGIVERFYGISIKTFGIDGIFTRVPVIIILIIAIGTGAYTLWMQRSVARTRAAQASADLTPPEDPGVPPSPGDSDDPPAKRTPLLDRLRPGVNGVFVLALGVVFGYVLYSSYDWSSDGARLPRLASVSGIVLVTGYFAQALLRKKGARSRIMDIGRTQTEDERSVIMWRSIKAVGTTLGLVSLIWTLGFHAGMPLYVFLYIWFFGRVGRVVPVIAGVAFILILYGFFDELLNLTWNDPLWSGPRDALDALVRGVTGGALGDR